MPDPFLVSISAALAGKAITSMYEFVRNRISGRKQAVAALEAAEGKSKESPEVQALAAELETIAAEDPQFAVELRERWNSVQHAETGGLINEISGNVSGKVVQARDITGNISL